MKELLDLRRVKDFYPAYRHIDEKQQKCVDVEEETAKMVFGRFMDIRSQFQARLLDVQGHAFAIGCMLMDLERDGVYKCVTCSEGTYGYSSFYKFCSDVFGFKRTTVQRLIGVATEFTGKSIKTTSDSQSDPDAKITYGVALPYVNFSFSQLDEMRGIDEKYRPRITVDCSVRDIRHLKKLYKTYVPKEGTTVKDDLEVWRKIHTQEQERANAKKNAIVFIPARASKEGCPTSGTLKNPPAQGKKSSSGEEEKSDFVKMFEDYDGADERDVVTPEQEKKIPFESIKKGLLRQLAMMRESAGSYWYGFCDIVSESLNKGVPDVYSSQQYDLVLKSNWKMRDELLSLKGGEVRRGGQSSSGEKLNLKNEKARKDWLAKYENWGVWLDVPEVSKVFYRYDFVNGASVIVEKCVEYYTYGKNKAMPLIKYSIIDKEHPEYDSSGAGGCSGVIAWLTKHAKEI